MKPLLLDIGPKVTHVGENGLALVMKIATNLSLAVQMLAFSEGVLLAEKSGIARETAVDVLTHSAMASPMVQYRGPFVLKHAGGGVVQREHDAERHAAGAGAGPSGGCASADHGGGQRISDRGARHGDWRNRISRWCSMCWHRMSGVSK